MYSYSGIRSIERTLNIIDGRDATVPCTVFFYCNCKVLILLNSMIASDIRAAISVAESTIAKKSFGYFTLLLRKP